MKTKVQTRKVYKINKSLAKKVIKGFFILFIVMILLIIGIPLAKKCYLSSWKYHKFKEYNLNIKMPRAYENLLEDKDGININTSAFISEFDVKVNENYVSKEANTIFKGINMLNGINLMIQCLNTEKTTKTLDEISEGNYLMTMIYYEDNYSIGPLNKEYVKVLNNDTVRNMVDLSNNAGNNTMVTYLIPLEEKEITITFFGKKEKISNNLKEIEKIISEIK